MWTKQKRPLAFWLEVALDIIQDPVKRYGELVGFAKFPAFMRILRKSCRTPRIISGLCSNFWQLCHEGWEECSDETEDGVEFRESGVDHGVGHYVVALADSYDTVGANLSLTDCRHKTYDAD